MRKNIKKRNVIIIVSAVIAVLAAALSVYFFIFKNDPDDDQQNNVYYYPIDFDEDIFENKNYMQLDRDLFYGDDNRLVSYSFEQKQSAPLIAQFFMQYFEAVINGDKDKVNGYLYNDELKFKEAFTKQMLYDMNVKYHSESDAEINGETVKVQNFTVSYKIFRNNGTFRQGFSGDSYIPQIYQIFTDANGETKISNILDIVLEK